MKKNISYQSYILFIFFILFSGINSLNAQININDKSKPVTTKSALTSSDLPAQFLEGVESYREFHLNPQLKDASEIQVGSEIIFEIDYSNKKYKGTVILVNEYIKGVTAIAAKIQGFNFGYGYMVISDKGMNLRVMIPEIYENSTVRKWNNKSYMLQYSKEYQLKRAASLNSAPDVLYKEPTEEPNGEIVQSELRTVPTLKSTSITKVTDKERAIRLMYVYTSAAVESMKAASLEINHDVSMSILESQVALDNSKTGIKLQLTGIHETQYGVIPTVTQALDWVIDAYDGKMDEVHAIRKAENADIVILAAQQFGGDRTGGVAYSLNSKTGSREQSGFVCIDPEYICGDYVVIHEIGHTFGCHHHRKATEMCSPARPNRLYEYGTAWEGMIENTRYVTLMGYEMNYCFPDNNSRHRIPYFSSPDITIDGTAIGDAKFSDNARAMRESKHIIATYGKGMRIQSRPGQYKEYGNPDPQIKSIIDKNNFELRVGDEIIFEREAGEVYGEYELTGKIVDKSGNNMNDDPYYDGNVYFLSGEFYIVPRELRSEYKALNKVYDGTTKVQFDYSGVITDRVVDGDVLSIDVNEHSGEFDSPNVGTDISVQQSGKIRLLGEKAFCYMEYEEYYGIFMYSLSANILPAPLTIQAKKIEIPYGTNPSTINLANAYTISGLVNNETESVLSGTLSISIDPSITSNSPVGVYPNVIIIKGYTANNYEITYKSADLIIKPSADYPDIPINLSGEALSSNAIRLTWDAADKATSYNIKRATSENGFYIAISITGITYTDNDLSPNTSYWYKVSAVNATGESFDSAPITIITKSELQTQMILFDPIPEQKLSDGSYKLTASVTSGLPISYMNSNADIATIDSEGLVTFLKAGKTTITASQNGNASFNAATSVSQELSIVENQTGLLLYPNPVSPNQTVSIRLDHNLNTSDVFTIEIISFTGFILKTEKRNTGAIISFEAPSYEGMYIVRIKELKKGFKLMVK